MGRGLRLMDQGQEKMRIKLVQISGTIFKTKLRRLDSDIQISSGTLGCFPVTAGSGEGS